MDIEIELDQPDFSRIVDYWLGGDYHLACDRAAAQEMESYVPDLPALMRTIWRVQQGLVLDWRGKGIKQFIVVGAGLPGKGAVHEIVSGATVLYLDMNLATVHFGQQILGDIPGAFYEWADYINFPRIQEIMHSYLKPAPVGVLAMQTLFLNPTEVHTFLNQLNHVVAPGSRVACLFFCQPGDPGERAGQEEFVQRYAMTGLPVFPIPESQIPPLIHPWHLTNHLNRINGLVEYINYNLRTVLPPLAGDMLPPAADGPTIAIMKK